MDVMLVLLFFGLLIAAIRDLQIREVPDTVSYGLIVVGLLGGLLTAILTRNVFTFYEHFAGFVVGALLGLFMYYTRQWGGGDAKLIMGVGAILGLSFTNLRFFEYLILLILGGALYGMLYTIGLAIRHRKTFVKGFKQVIRTKRVHRLRMFLVSFGILLFVGMFFTTYPLKLILGFAIVGLYLIAYSWICMRVIENDIMTKTYPVGKLTEGDWLVEDVKHRGKVIVTPLNTGITKAQIAILKKKKVKTVIVREGIPFVPSFVIAFIALLYINATYGSFLLLFF